MLKERNCIICNKPIVIIRENPKRLKVCCSGKCKTIYNKYRRDKDCLFFDDTLDTWKKLTLNEYIIEEMRSYE